MTRLHVQSQNCYLLVDDHKSVLFSYETPVALHEKATDIYYKSAQKFSNTTSGHINAWLAGKPAQALPQVQLEAFAGPPMRPATQPDEQTEPALA